MGIGRRASARISRRQGIPALAAVIGVASAAAIVTSITSPANSLVPANPIGGSRTAIVFPQRDFVSLDGYAADDQVVIRVKHDTSVYPGATTVYESEPTTPDDAGVIEVNHPGGVCWVTKTPDIRPGDLVEVEVLAGTDAGRIEGTIVANVTTKRPVKVNATTVEIHGTASDIPGLGGAPLPLAQLEQRLVAPGSLFEANNRRTLRAPGAGGGEGTLVFDAGLNWTATYAGLSPADVDLAMSAEARIHWLGNPAIAPATESTIYENGPLTLPGPAAPCTAPLEVLPPPVGSELVPPTAPTNLVATGDGINKATLTWDPSTDNVGVTAYGVFRNGQNIATVSNGDGSAPSKTGYVDNNLPPGTYTYHVVALDEVGNVSDPSNTSGSVVAIERVDVNTFPVNSPPVLPVNIIVFPSRDFISPGGFLGDDLVTVQVLRKNAAGQTIVISSSAGIQPDAEGLAEVNHPGAACWEGVTPEIRVGDVIRTIAYNPANVSVPNPDGIRTIDETTVSGVTAFRPVIDVPATPGNNDGIVSVHGTALGADGRPIPVDQIEQRMIATHGVGLWDLNGRRALRASSVAQDGVLGYDTVNNPMGINWTATYSGLDEADVARFAEADTRIHWLGRDPLTLAEATIFENADGNPPGPAGPGCTSPLEAADLVNPQPPTNVAVQGVGNQVTITWDEPAAPADNWYVAGYRVYDNGTAVANVPAGVGLLALSGLTPGAHSYTLRSYDTASPRGAGADIITQLIAGFGNLYGNLSDPSNVAVHTSDDVIPPSKPVLTVTVTGSTASLSWTASTDDVGVDHYDVRRDGTLIGTVTGTSLDDAGLAVGNYSYTVEAFDAAGNGSLSDAVVAHVVAVADTEAPSTPIGVTATVRPDVHGRNVLLSWSASTDNVGVSAYELHRAAFGVAAPGPVLTTVNGSALSYIDANLPAGTYTYSVIAKDSAGNASAASAAVVGQVANDPPVAPKSVIAFPARDFISTTGNVPGRDYTFSVFRNDVEVFTSGPATADGTGTAEVNHPGGACWNVNTPNLKPGDVVRLIDTVTGVAEQTTIANVTAERPIATGAGTVVIHGTAQDTAGLPLPIAQIEQRLVANRDLFEKNGNRTLRAGAGLDGTIAYDAGPNNTHWTATYTGLSAKDVIRAVGGTAADGSVFVGAESRAHWLGRDPLALTEATIFENGPGVVGGPPTPDCVTPAEGGYPAASFQPASLVLPSFGNVRFTPAPASTSGNQTVTISNGGAGPTAQLHVTNVYIAGANPGDFLRTGGTCAATPFTLNPGASCTVLVAFRPTALGLRQGYLAFTDDAANTTDQAIALTGNGIDATGPALTATPNPLAFGTVTATSTGTNLSTVIRNPSTGAPATATLAISALSIVGSTDFTTGPLPVACGSIAPGNVASCTITVNFKPSGTATRTASLVLTHNAIQGGATQTVIPLTGAGNGAVLTWGTTSVKFGTVKRNTTATQTVSLKNSGPQAANLGATPFVVTGTGFSLGASTCGATLAVNASCNVQVRYTALNAPLTAAGSLQVTAANGLPLTVFTALSATVK